MGLFLFEIMVCAPSSSSAKLLVGLFKVTLRREREMFLWILTFCRNRFIPNALLSSKPQGDKLELI